MDKQLLLSKIMLLKEGEKADAKLLLDGWKNFLRFKVLIVPKIRGEKMSIAAMLPLRREAVYIIINTLRKLIKSKDETSIAIESFSPIWENDKMTDKKKSNGKITIGRKNLEEGSIIYIMIDTNTDKKYVFKLQPTPYIKLYRDGVELDKTESSNLWAEAFASLLEQVLSVFPEILPDPERELPEKTTDNNNSSNEINIDDVF